MAQPRSNREEGRGNEGQPARAGEEHPNAQEDQDGGQSVGKEADTLGRAFERRAEAVHPGDRGHEQEVGRTVDRRLAHVPDDPAAFGQVLRVAQQHGRVFLGPAAQVRLGMDVRGQGDEQQDDECDVERAEAAVLGDGGVGQGGARLAWARPAAAMSNRGHEPRA